MRVVQNRNSDRWCVKDQNNLELAQRNNWRYINICTDSKSNLDIINSPADVNKNTIKKLNPWVEDIRQRINEAEGVGCKIRFTWCPAHKNISGNETADSAAKDGALIGEPIDNKIAFSEALASWRSNYNQMEEDYKESINIGTGKYYMNNFSEAGRGWRPLNNIIQVSDDQRKSLKTQSTPGICVYLVENRGTVSPEGQKAIGEEEEEEDQNNLAEMTGQQDAG
ncbi:uncharacterized protein LOC118646310 isoform X1 [Monomorium pharaonis]|uniref:uncharacterized protein LOC118646310 isoform X1 n=1 Tax=Monomorium pharaonis TaxID=307658 RepID=UPI001746E7AD|nr:uncharacterized protein LOC118646310 isoform X1 [Monomorium pharaonis]